ncbi:MAG: imidazoleglycerol-phosphate dehydratase HisB [Myxococcales bacterium]|nr:imidazoleglycerol-phosphate dehydratase HisB [Polyangiaceae bacterium]MDW8251043.1 imidazoleglycerol-phosphate dehydratase HisB [Myxococcales bacterium]
MTSRTFELKRTTGETEIKVRVALDGEGKAEVNTGLGFLDHMVAQLARHGKMDITLRCKGDLHIDDHHTTEDCGLALGAVLLGLAGDRRGLRRFGQAYAPLDEALARAVVDLSGRPWPEIHLGLRREKLGEVACENLVHFLQSLAIAGRMNLHVDVLRGDNDHHRVEASFKAVALALRQAFTQEGGGVPSTKGVLG